MRSAIALPILAALAAGCDPREPPAVDGTLPAARPLQRIGSVHDGDTCHVLDDDREGRGRVRLHGIDAPEAGQPFGTVARDRLRALIMGKAVAVETSARIGTGGPSFAWRSTATTWGTRW